MHLGGIPVGEGPHIITIMGKLNPVVLAEMRQANREGYAKSEDANKIEGKEPRKKWRVADKYVDSRQQR